MLKIRLLIILLFAATYASAQFSVGAKGGLSWARVAFFPRMSQDYAMVKHGGLVLRYISEPHFGIQTEFNYAQKGWHQIFKNSTNYYERIIDYAEMPILAHGYFGSDKLRIFLNAGLALSYAMSASYNSRVDEITIEKEYKFDNDIDNRFEFGIMFGGGVEYKIKSHSIFIDARYSYSLTNLRELEDAQEIDYARNTYFNISLGYLYNFK